MRIEAEGTFSEGDTIVARLGEGGGGGDHESLVAQFAHRSDHTVGGGGYQHVGETGPSWAGREASQDRSSRSA